MGIIVKELNDNEFRQLIKYSYRIIYTIQNDQVQIITIIHSLLFCHHLVLWFPVSLFYKYPMQIGNRYEIYIQREGWLNLVYFPQGFWCFPYLYQYQVLQQTMLLCRDAGWLYPINVDNPRDFSHFCW